MARNGKIGREAWLPIHGKDRHRLRKIMEYLRVTRGLNRPPSMADVLRFAVRCADRLVARQVRKAMSRREKT